jgi:hypothetical protein
VTLAVAHGGLPDDRVQDFLVAVTEVVANALQHGDTTAQRRHRPPGMGLWVARQLAIASGPNGTVVRFTIGR